MTIDELAGLCLDGHALFIEKEVDESFAGVGTGSFGSKADVLPVTQHIVVADVIEIGSLFVIGQDEARESNPDGCFTGADPIGGGDDRLDEYRFCSGQDHG